MAVGRIQRRLALAIVLTALIPLVAAIAMGEWVVRETSARFYTPEVGTRLDDALDVYQDLARAVKARMRVSAAAMAGDVTLNQALSRGDQAALEARLSQLFHAETDLVSLIVEDANGEVLAEERRSEELDEEKELDLEVRVPLASGEAAPALVAVFATDAQRFQERDQLSLFLDVYRAVERRREEDDSGRLYAFAALLGLTILMAIGVGTSLARGVSTRIGKLAEATAEVGAGNLDVRVPETGRDEITDLAVAFNRMLGEVEASRARIEFLQRIGAWQEMARRLAHEIKNPLTPIQLAVQEVHRRYPGDDPSYQRMLDTTLEIVEDEVGTLRRLVGEFSNFARLPEAELKPEDLGEFLQELQARGARPSYDALTSGAQPSGSVSSSAQPSGSVSSAAQPSGSEPSGAQPQVAMAPGVDLGFELDLPPGPLPARLDRDMLKRALLNLVENAAQAGRGRADGAPPRVEVRVTRQGSHWVIDVDDDGPGIAEEDRLKVFDPYFTSKPDGTGLGLAIVKKIIVEHGGTITAGSSPLGGARLRVKLPTSATSPA
ncbi:MAG: HAMP domain-containing protein [Polyangiaceae bacterium]|nr:HAMP domain-containing protein [Polyangiaceae bacterium]MCW5788998.1 HAMP domain-containing protein [Polyangiaceae bacterium]